MARPNFNEVFQYLRRYAADATGQTAGEVTPQLKENLGRFLDGALSEDERGLLFKQVRESQQAFDYLATAIRGKKGGGKIRRPAKR